MSPEKAIVSLIAEAINMLREPALDCVQQVHDVILKNIVQSGPSKSTSPKPVDFYDSETLADFVLGYNIDTELLSRYPKACENLSSLTIGVLQKWKEEADEMVWIRSRVFFLGGGGGGGLYVFEMYCLNDTT